MAKASIVPTKVNVVFEPDEDLDTVALELELQPGQAGGAQLVRQCSHKGFNFSYFDGTIRDGVTLMAVPMTIPAYFDQIAKTQTIKKDIRKLFLLRTGATEVGVEKNKRFKFFMDMLAAGPHGCPVAVLMKEGTDANGNSPNFFTFNNMRFYPFLMREFTVGYYVCDDHARHFHWPKYDPTDIGVALDYPVAYDPTLGLFTTRGAHYEKEQKPKKP